MRNLIYAINLTLDGCCDHTKLIGNEDVHEYHAKLLRDVDVLLYGRITYQLMVPYWPDAAKNHTGMVKEMNDFAQAFDAVSKIVVVSKSLEKAEGNKTSIVRTNLHDEVMKLKQQPGKSILTGGVDIPAQLIQLRLVDEFHIVVQPMMVGEGRRLLDAVNLPERLELKLAASKIFTSGCVALRYLKS